MKRYFAISLLLAASACSLYGQVVDTTICAVLKNPQTFDGKIVRIKATVSAGFDQFVIKDAGCGHNVNAIWLAFPEGTKAKSGPAAVVQLQPAHNFSGTVPATVRTPVTLDKSKDFKQFDSLLATPHKAGGMCIGCNRYDVNATLVGRLDGVEDAGVKRDASGKIIAIPGFGNLNAYNARLVLQSVSDVSPQEIDYSKTDAVTKTDIVPAPSFGSPGAADDPLAAAHKSALGFGAGSPFGVKIERAAAAFGKPGEHNGVNGVTIANGIANEASAKNEAQGAKDSPDGVLYNCTFNNGRLQGDAITRAIIHIGQHVADVRNPEAGSERDDLAEQEYKAWVTTVLAAAATGQKTLTLPGGYLLWNSAWGNSDRDKLLDDTLSRFISTEELLSR